MASTRNIGITISQFSHILATLKLGICAKFQDYILLQTKLFWQKTMRPLVAEKTSSYSSTHGQDYRGTNRKPTQLLPISGRDKWTCFTDTHQMYTAHKAGMWTTQYNNADQHLTMINLTTRNPFLKCYPSISYQISCVQGCKG